MVKNKKPKRVIVEMYGSGGSLSDDDEYFPALNNMLNYISTAYTSIKQGVEHLGSLELSGDIFEWSCSQSKMMCEKTNSTCRPSKWVKIEDGLLIFLLLCFFPLIALVLWQNKKQIMSYTTSSYQGY